jgi:uncharacterized protein (TIGR03067 family)
MRRFALLAVSLFAVALSASAEDKKDVPKDLLPFQGTWKAVAGKKGGEDAPAAELERLKLKFEGDALTITEGTRDTVGGYSVNPKADPKEIDLISPKKETVKGVYKFDKDGKLTIGFVRGKDAARPKGFDDKEAAYLTLEKEKAEKK